VNWRKDHGQSLTEVFRREIFPVLTPLAVDQGHPFPHLLNKSLNLAVLLMRPRNQERLFAVVQVPAVLPRFVTLPTEFHRGRYAAGVCKLLDLPQLVASSPAEYVRIATELANNPQRRVTVGKLMQERSDMIFADRTSARAIQTTFLQLVADARAR